MLNVDFGTVNYGLIFPLFTVLTRQIRVITQIQSIHHHFQEVNTRTESQGQNHSQKPSAAALEKHKLVCPRRKACKEQRDQRETHLGQNFNQYLISILHHL